MKIPIKYRKGCMNDGINSLYLKSISTKRHWELAPHNRNPRKYPNNVEMLESKL